MARRVGALFDWRNFAISARVECAIAAGERNIAADGRALEAGNIAQGIESLLSETLTRRRVGIL